MSLSQKVQERLDKINELQQTIVNATHQIEDLLFPQINIKTKKLKIKNIEPGTINTTPKKKGQVMEKMDITDEIILEITKRIDNGEVLTTVMKDYPFSAATYYNRIKKGKTENTPPKKKRIPDETILEIKKRVDNGELVSQIVKDYSISTVTYYTRLKKLTDNEPTPKEPTPEERYSGEVNVGKPKLITEDEFDEIRALKEDEKYSLSEVIDATNNFNAPEKEIKRAFASGSYNTYTMFRK